jgi:hypothetical protein
VAAIALWWTGLAAIAELGGDVSDGAKRGLEALVEAALSAAAVPRLDPAPKRLASAILGLGAVHGLRELLGEPEAFEDLRRACADAIARLVPPGADGGAPWVEAALRQPRALAEARLRPLLVLALRTARAAEPLPAGPAEILAATSP